MAGKSLARTFLTAFALAKTAQVFYDDKRNHEKELINGLLRFGFTRFNDSGMDSCLTAKVQRPFEMPTVFWLLELRFVAMLSALACFSFGALSLRRSPR